MIMANQVENLDNLFSGVQCHHGYIAGGGAITNEWTTPIGNQEIYTDYIDTSKWNPGDYIYFFGKYPSSSSGAWFAIAAYDENDSFLSRPTGGTTQTAPQVSDGYLFNGIVQIPSNAKKIKLTGRTFGGPLFACRAQDLSDAIPFQNVV